MITLKDLYKISLDVFSFEIYIYYGDRKGILPIFKQFGYNEEDIGCGMGFAFYKRRKAVCCIIKKDNRDVNDVIETTVHEVTHGIHYMLDELELGYSYDNGRELLANIFEYVMPKAMFYITRKIRGAKKKNLLKRKQTQHKKKIKDDLS